MTKKILLAFMLASSLAACNKQTNNNSSPSSSSESSSSASVDASMEEQAKKAVLNGLKDPGSAQFKNVRQVRPGQFCGEVNAKNAMGGYVGFKQFFWTISAPNHADLQLSDTSQSCK